MLPPQYALPSSRTLMCPSHQPPAPLSRNIALVEVEEQCLSTHLALRVRPLLVQAQKTKLHSQPNHRDPPCHLHLQNLTYQHLQTALPPTRTQEITKENNQHRSACGNFWCMQMMPYWCTSHSCVERNCGAFYIFIAQHLHFRSLSCDSPQVWKPN